MMRLDLYLSKTQNLSRNQAQALIKASFVKVENRIVKKVSFQTVGDEKIEILKDKIYVSRAGDKLNLFLQNRDIKISDLEILDVGASTGGFTEVLLENGAKNITALDVGTLQLSEKLKNDTRVISIEKMDIRKFKNATKFDLITCDVSFISLLSIVDSLDRLANNKLILLFKPQFEVGKDIKRDRNGVILDKIAVEQSLEKFLKTVKKMFSWKLLISEKSKLKGKEGNEEIFLYFKKEVDK